MPTKEILYLCSRCAGRTVHPNQPGPKPADSFSPPKTSQHHAPSLHFSVFDNTRVAWTEYTHDLGSGTTRSPTLNMRPMLATLENLQHSVPLEYSWNASRSGKAKGVHAKEARPRCSISYHCLLLLLFHDEEQHAESPETHTVPHGLGRRHWDRRVPGLVVDAPAFGVGRVAFLVRFGGDVGLLLRAILLGGQLACPAAVRFWTSDLRGPREGSGPCGDAAAAVAGVAWNVELLQSRRGSFVIG